MKLDSDEIKNPLCAMAANHIGVRPDFKGKIPKIAIISGNNPNNKPAIKKEIASIKKKPMRRSRRKTKLL